MLTVDGDDKKSQIGTLGPPNTSGESTQGLCYGGCCITNNNDNVIHTTAKQTYHYNGEYSDFDEENRLNHSHTAQAVNMADAEGYNDDLLNKVVEEYSLNPVIILNLENEKTKKKSKEETGK